MKCPICGLAPSKSFAAKYVLALTCGAKDCGHIYAKDPLPGQGVEPCDAVEEKYAQYKSRNERLIGFLARREVLGPTSRILDFGAGAGHILRSIRDVYPDTHIAFTEADPESAAHLRRRGYVHMVELAGSGDVFDLILLVEVIEHVEDPVGLLHLLRAKLAANGRMFLTTPCGENRVGNRVADAYDDPAHIHFFTEVSFRKCLRAAGLSMKLEQISEMSIPESFPMGPIKDWGRKARALAFGHHQLTGFATAVADIAREPV